MAESNENNDWLRQAHKFLGSDFWVDFKDLIVGSGPLANLYESEKELVCLVDLPGMQMQDVEVYVHHRTLKIKGTLNLQIQGYRLVQEEIYQGEFERIIELPHPVMDQPVHAFYQRGLLIVRMLRLFAKDNPQYKVEVQDYGK